jgi:pilus assembly protein CpaD
MIKTQKANFPAISSRSAKLAGVVTLSILLTGCGGARAPREAPPVDPVREAHLHRTVLEAHTPTAIPVEARLVLAAHRSRI